MTRKDFEALALSLGRRWSHPEVTSEDSQRDWDRGYMEAIEAVMDCCQMQNGKFKRVFFNAAVIKAMGGDS
jgi:hypothetical protein